MISSRNILVIAGEPSGDLHASLLIRELLSIEPEMKFWGFGGKLMRKEGVDTIVDVSELAVMGLVDVVRHIAKLRRFMRMLIELAETRKPNGAILVDYPGFNLSILPKLKQMGVPVGYYISPQLWAWGEHRVRKIEKFVDKMVCILPFEREFYARHNIDVEYVGHPFVDIVVPEVSEREFRESIGIGDAEFLLLMPGSRRKEILRMLPEMLNVHQLLSTDNFEISAIIAATDSTEGLIRTMVPQRQNLRIVSGLTYSAMAYARAGIITSGSATLEALISKLPSVVLYRVDPLTWAVGKNLIKTPHIALANLVAGERIFPEFIQKINSEKLCGEVRRILSDEQMREDMKNKMNAAIRNLGDGGAAKRAATIFIKLFSKNS